MMMIAVQHANPAELRRLGAALRSPRAQRRAADVGWIRERFDEYGCIERAREVAHALAGAAPRAGSEPRPLAGVRDKRFVQGLVRWSSIGLS